MPSQGLGTAKSTNNLFEFQIRRAGRSYLRRLSEVTLRAKPLNRPKEARAVHWEMHFLCNILNLSRRGKERLRSLVLPDDGFLKKVPGVIHIGANTGQEREYYASLGLNVLWVEPIPEVFQVLQSNIAALTKQHAYCSLLTDQHGAEYNFHIANNGGASSSIFDFGKHRDIWPDVFYTRELRIRATTLAHLIDAERIDLCKYGALILDTQGSELLVLKGSIRYLDRFRFIKSEVADFESYIGCCEILELTAFLRRHGFEMHRKMSFAKRKGGGTYYDVLYRHV